MEDVEEWLGTDMVRAYCYFMFVLDLTFPIAFLNISSTLILFASGVTGELLVKLYLLFYLKNNKNITRLCFTLS